MAKKTSNKELLNRVKTFKMSSENYMKENLYKQWEKNQHIFDLVHENKALLTDPRYRHRSKLYLPKGRNSLIRKLAALIGTYFSTQDVVSLKPRKKKDPLMAEAAKLLFAAVNYRLEHTLNFFLVAVFVWLDVLKFGRGVVCLGWDYLDDEKTETVAVPMKNEDGEIEDVEEREVTTVNVIRDEPTMRHVALDNLFVAPTADPLDPINSSPALVERMPIFVYEARERWESGEWKKPKGFNINDDEALEEYRWTPSDFEEIIYGAEIDEFSQKKSWRQVELWRCFIRSEGKDVFFLSLKGEFMLTDPEPVEAKWPCKGRPYVMGGFTPESRKVYWKGFPEIIQGLQRELNAIRNQRRDNVTLALNKKLLIRNTAGIDVNSLLYSRPGAPITGDDVSEYAIRELKYDDVTASSYREQAENERSFEETTGIRPYNDRGVAREQSAAGASLLTEEQNTIISMEVRIINETLMIPWLEMITQFEQKWEDEEVLRHVADQNGIDFDTVWTEEAIEGKFDIEVDAGIGATSNELKIQKLGMIIDRAMAVNTQYGAPVINLIEMLREALPLAGQENADKYINEGVIQFVMQKFGQVAQQSLMNPAAMPPQLVNPGNSGGNQIESAQGYGSDKQIYR